MSLEILALREAVCVRREKERAKRGRRSVRSLFSSACLPRYKRHHSHYRRQSELHRDGQRRIHQAIADQKPERGTQKGQQKWTNKGQPLHASYCFQSGSIRGTNDIETYLTTLSEDKTINKPTEATVEPKS